MSHLRTQVDWDVWPMNYENGEPVKLGDKVSLGNDSGGVVVCLIDDGMYSEAYPEEQWSYLKNGVLINFPLHGLIHYEFSIEPDVKLQHKEP